VALLISEDPDQRELLEWLTPWKMEKTYPDYLLAVYFGKYQVSVPIRDRRPDMLRVDIQRKPYAPKDKKHDWYPGLDELTNMDAARNCLKELAPLITKNSEVRICRRVV
jgi:hypothetical protein